MEEIGPPALGSVPDLFPQRPLRGFLRVLGDSRFSAVFEFETVRARSFAPLKNAGLRMTSFK
jgi:hypothetical protein